MADTIPDEYQIQVARELGCDGNQIGVMVNDGMSKGDYAHLVPASDMLRSMEERYGVDFRADWTSAGDGWVLGCTAVDGEFAGESFLVEAVADGGGVSMYDDYYSTLRQGDFERYMGEALSGAVADTGLGGLEFTQVTNLTGKTNQATALDAPVEDVDGIIVSHLLVYGRKGLTESDGAKLADALAERLERDGMKASLYVAYYPWCDNWEDARAALSTVSPEWRASRMT